MFSLEVPWTLCPVNLSIVLPCIRCGIRFGLSVLIGQRHFIHVHGADVGLGHRQQQHRHTDGTAGRESVNTVHGHMSPPVWLAQFSFTKFKYQPSPSLLSFNPPVFWLFVMYPSLTFFNSVNRSLFFCSVWSSCSSLRFGWTVALRLKLSVVT